MNAIRKGDEVVVLAGGDKGKRGKVLEVDAKRGRVRVERVRIQKKHVRPSQKHPHGGIVQQEGFLDLSNVALWDPKSQSGCRVGVRVLEDGRKVRVSKKSGEMLD